MELFKNPAAAPDVGSPGTTRPLYWMFVFLSLVPTAIVLPMAPTKIGIAILASDLNLYAADAGGSGLAEKYNYPAGGAIKNTIAVGGQPIGIAVTPALSKENN